MSINGSTDKENVGDRGIYEKGGNPAVCHDLEGITLSKITWTEAYQYCRVLRCGIQKGELVETQSVDWGCQELAGGSRKEMVV